MKPRTDKWAQGKLDHWTPIQWTGGPVQIHDVRFVWWYRAWLWIKFKVLRQKTGFYFGRYRCFTDLGDKCDYSAETLYYRPKGMKKYEN